MANWFDFDNYIKPARLTAPRAVTISRWAMIEMAIPPRGKGSQSSEELPALWFSDWDVPRQYLPLNTTRRQQLAELFGPDPDNCIGKRITLSAGKQSGKATVVISRAEQAAGQRATLPASRDDHGFTPDGKLNGVTERATTGNGDEKAQYAAAFNLMQKLRKEWKQLGGTPNPLPSKLSLDEIGAEVAVAQDAIVKLTAPTAVTEIDFMAGLEKSNLPYAVVGTDGQTDIGVGD